MRNHQPSLFGPPNAYGESLPKDVCAAKHGGNPASADACARVEPHIRDTHAKIMGLVRAAGSRGMTSKEIAAALGVQLNTISGRLSELRAMGWLAVNGQRRDGAAVLVVGALAPRE